MGVVSFQGLILYSFSNAFLFNYQNIFVFVFKFIIKKPIALTKISF